MAKADVQTATDVMTILAPQYRGLSAALFPAGNDDPTTVDTPIKLMLDDARAEAARLIALTADPTCRNTVVVLVVGGGEGTTSGLSNASLATGRRQFPERRRPPRAGLRDRDRAADRGRCRAAGHCHDDRRAVLRNSQVAD